MDQHDKAGASLCSGRLHQMILGSCGIIGTTSFSVDSLLRITPLPLQPPKFLSQAIRFLCGLFISAPKGPQPGGGSGGAHAAFDVETRQSRQLGSAVRIVMRVRVYRCK
jgi:hypothetical protein